MFVCVKKPRPKIFHSRKLKAFLALRGKIAIHFELAFLVVLVVSSIIVFWSMRIVVKALKDRRRHWGLTAESEVNQTRLQPPQTSKVFLRAFTNIFFFLLGCAIFVLEGPRFFRKYRDDSGAGFIMVLVFPLMFGCSGVLRIFMAATRSHLYFSCLRHGLLLQLQVVRLAGNSYKDAQSNEHVLFPPCRLVISFCASYFTLLHLLQASLLNDYGSLITSKLILAQYV